MSSKQILVVDDEIELLELYKDFLESEGYAVTIAKSGEEAFDFISKENKKFDLTISDSYMGKMTGLDLFLKIKELDPQNIPMFYLSTGDHNKSEKDLVALGLKRLIIKPFDLDELILIIKSDLK